ncbi:hypothetical protein I6G66_03875 [Delftia acidovorans]|mgnify:FL=1|uniref:Uncharacterized protein n=1 Tax=Delftia acidovorans TaxID=80866 RepID=A0A7T2S5B1_DELAC|nr:hypothetical protein [Delftia acidovorans]QPS09186.1 hypothetical protein I6G66_03875 [Delftia acidovorans]
MNENNFEISIDHAFDGNGDAAFLIKITNQFIEINVYIPSSQAEELKKLNLDSTEYIKLGESANSPVHWKKGDDRDLYLLIGEDCESWDIVLTISTELITEIINGIDDLA